MKKAIIIITIYSLLSGVVLNLGHAGTPSYIIELGVNEKLFGYFFSAMSLGLVISSPFWGTLGDKHHRKYIIALSLAGYGIGQIMFGTFTNEYALLAARLFSGIAIGGAVVNFIAYLNETISGDSRKKVMSINIAINIVASSLGYFFGGLISDSLPSYGLTFYVQGLLAFLLALYIILLFSKPEREIVLHKEKQGIIKNFSNLKKLDRKTNTLFITLFIATLSYTSISKFLDVYITDLSGSATVLGTYVALTGIVGLITNIVIYPIFLSNINAKINFITNLFLGGLLVIITFTMPNVVLGLMTVFMVFMMTKAIYTVLSIELLSENDKLPQGLLMGIRQSFISLGMVIAPIIGGYIYAFNSNLLFILSGILLIISSFVFLTAYVRKS